MSPFIITEHVIDAAHIREYARATADDQNAVLKLHVKRYTPRDNPSPRKGDVTVIGGHANGFPKELYEPLWDDILREWTKQGIRIRDIWIADCAWQGQSGVLNQRAGLLGNDPGWYDHSRDTVHMINTFRMPRPLIAVGHSFGGNALAHAALLHPRLFHSVVLLDAVIAARVRGPASNGAAPAAASARRRDVWPSRGHAAAVFRESPFYGSWDERVLERWIRYGLRPDGGGGGDEKVTLVTTKHQEVFTFVRPSWPAFGPDADATRPPASPPPKMTNPAWLRDLLPPAATHLDPALYPFYRPEPISTHNQLDRLRPGALFLNAANSHIMHPSDVAARTALTGTGLGGSGGRAAGRVRAVTHPTCGHLVPFEDPGFCARETGSFVRGEVDVWRAEEREFEAWAGGANAEKTTVGEEWRLYFGARRGGVKAKM